MLTFAPDDTRPADLGPEGVRFISAKDSPIHWPLLLTANEAAGTLAVFELRSRR